MSRIGSASFWRRIKRLLQVFLLVPFDRLARLGAGGGPGGNDILIVRVDGIGDFLLWLDSARALRGLYPRPNRLVLAAHASWAPMARELGIFDEVIAIAHKNFLKRPFYRAGVVRAIARRRFRLALHPTYSRDFQCADALVRACRAAEKIGFEGDLSNYTAREKRIAEKWYTRLIPADPGQKMELVRNADFVRALGATSFRASVPILSARFAAPPGLPEAYFLLFPGASWGGKRWPPASFAALADRLHRSTGLPGVLCGDGADAASAREIASLSRAPLVNLAGKTSLMGLAEAIRGAAVAVSNDSCAVHFAAATGAPSVCILGGGHFGRFLPYILEGEADRDLSPAIVNRPMECYGCNWQCIHPVSASGPVRCIAEVSLEAVAAKAEEILNRRSRSHARGA